MTAGESSVLIFLFLFLKLKRYKIRILFKLVVMVQITVNNYITFEFKEKDRFVGKDFEIWSVRVKLILLDKELWGNVSG